MYKVLLVDDEDFIIDGLKAIINWQDYNLEICGSASNGEEALNIFKESSPEIIMTDITMPKVNGLDLISEVKKINPDIKFIILSGYDDFNYIKQGMNLGIENYLLKPINEEELISTLQNTVKKIESSLNKNSLLKNNLDILKDNILHRWVTNNIESQELMDRADLLNLNLKFHHYVTCFIKILFPFNENNLSFNKEKTKIVSEIYDLCKNIFINYKGLYHYGDLDGNIVAICGCDIKDFIFDDLNKILNEAMECIHSKLNIDVFITIGSIQNSYTNVFQSYIHSKNLQEYMLVLPENRVIYYDKIVNEISNKTKIKEDLDIDSFKKLLLSKNRKSILNFINKFFDELKSCECISPSDIQNYAIEIMLTIIKEEEELNVINNTTSKDYKLILSNLLKLTNIDNLKLEIQKQIELFLVSFENKSKNLSPVIQQIINYINNNYSKELSLKTLGVEFNINSTYLGQLFQKEIGELFSDYVNKIRIEKAKELLLTTSLKTNEIALSVGYSDPNYFYKKFKNYLGISPTELRNNKKY